MPTKVLYPGTSQQVMFYVTGPPKEETKLLSNLLSSHCLCSPALLRCPSLKKVIKPRGRQITTGEGERRQETNLGAEFFIRGLFEQQKEEQQRSQRRVFNTQTTTTTTTTENQQSLTADDVLAVTYIPPLSVDRLYNESANINNEVPEAKTRGKRVLAAAFLPPEDSGAIRDEVSILVLGCSSLFSLLSLCSLT